MNLGCLKVEKGSLLNYEILFTGNVEWKCSCFPDFMSTAISSTFRFVQSDVHPVRFRFYLFVFSIFISIGLSSDDSLSSITFVIQVFVLCPMSPTDWNCNGTYPLNSEFEVLLSLSYRVTCQFVAFMHTYLYCP